MIMPLAQSLYNADVRKVVVMGLAPLPLPARSAESICYATSSDALG